MCGTVGCATLPSGDGLFRRGRQQEPPHDGPTIAMSIRAAGRKPQLKTLPLTQGMTLQTALEEAGLTRRFKNMEIRVLRVTPQSNGMPVPLQAEYDAVQNRVGVLHDMTLYPGDKIVIVEDTATQFDKAIARFSGVLGLK